MARATLLMYPLGHLVVGPVASAVDGEFVDVTVGVVMVSSSGKFGS